jgi:hypothetical protein
LDTYSLALGAAFCGGGGSIIIGGEGAWMYILGGFLLDIRGDGTVYERVYRTK